MAESIVFNAIPLVTGGLTLVAFIAACVMFVRLRSIKADQETLHGTNDEKKVEVLRTLSGRLGLPLDKLGKKEAFELAKRELDRMAKQDHHRFIMYIIGMGLLAVVAILSIKIPPPTAAKLFESDSISGVFCEEKNVQNISATYFDTVDINLSACTGASETGSRSYRIMWPARSPKNHIPTNRNGYTQCFVSDLSERAPQLITQLKEAFIRVSQRVPCSVSFSIYRIISLSYTDLQNQSNISGFLQSYNRGDTRKFDIEQISTTKLPRSDLMQEFDARATDNALDEALIAMAAQFRISNIPRPN